jgi:hypothetical protein
MNSVSYRPARVHRLVESIPGLIKSLKTSSLMRPDWRKTGKSQLGKVSGGIKTKGHRGNQQSCSGGGH